MEYHPLLKVFPKEEIDRVFSYEYCELDGTFLGFTEVYENLANIIPKHFTIIDLGCYAAAQCYYFKDHKSYVGVDISKCERFNMPNTKHYLKTIQQFLEEDLEEFDLNETFAISSYVPDFEALELITKTFRNVFVYYPHGSQKLIK